MHKTSASCLAFELRRTGRRTKKQKKKTPDARACPLLRTGKMNRGLKESAFQLKPKDWLATDQSATKAHNLHYIGR